MPFATGHKLRVKHSALKFWKPTKQCETSLQTQWFSKVNMLNSKTKLFNALQYAKKNLKQININYYNTILQTSPNYVVRVRIYFSK